MELSVVEFGPLIQEATPEKIVVVSWAGNDWQNSGPRLRFFDSVEEFIRYLRSC